MNVRVVFKMLGKLLVAEACMLLLPLIVCLVGIGTGNPAEGGTWWGFLATMGILVAIGLPLCFLKPRENHLYVKEGMVLVAMGWMSLSLIGALPFVFAGRISYIDAVFETVSGFTTTGATILTDIEAMPRSLLFWRSFTHWIGGMGVLVFILAILPGVGAGDVHAFRAEAPGPSVGKLASKLRHTARILYLIYFGLTLVLTIMLVCSPKMDFFDAITHAFATAGTGGFSTRAASIGAFNDVYIEMVLAIFMFIFATNFNVFYFILIGQVRKAFRCEEYWAYVGISFVATLAIALNIMSSTAGFGQALRYSLFQVASISSTTGFTSLNYETWPTLSLAIILLLTVIGGCAGSSGGGLKVARVLLFGKAGMADLRRLNHPRQVISVRMDGEVVDESTIRNARVVVGVWLIVLALSSLLLSFDTQATAGLSTADSLLSNFTASLTCLANVGPGLSLVGPAGNFSTYGVGSKILLCIDMLMGRLEFLPIIAILSPTTWMRK